MNELHVYDRISEAVGWTPMVRLGPTVDDFDCEVFAKIEFLNPMGSVKDRIARYMIEKAIAEGRLQAGDMVVENSSGNTAICLRAMGIDLVLVDGDLPPDDPESYNRKAREIVASTPGAYFPDQHNNRENSEAHYHTTGPEIWRQMGGRIDYLVAGIGTGGTICGVSRYLKEQDPSIEVVAVDPEGSVFYDHFHTGRQAEPAPYAVEGLGDEEIIGCPNFDLIDDMYRVSDREAFRAARGLARREAILAGGSSGAALWGVRELAGRLDRPARIVTVFPDSGTRYLSTIFNDEWMKERGFL
jgi:cystathionine beta-synthase